MVSWRQTSPGSTGKILIFIFLLGTNIFADILFSNVFVIAKIEESHCKIFRRLILPYCNSTLKIELLTIIYKFDNDVNYF